MKKIKKPITKELPLFKLYLDDLESIYDILKQNAKDIVIRVDTGSEEYQSEDIKQLKELETKRIHDLSIECRDPYIRIGFYPSFAEINFGEDSTYNRGILSEIEDIISKRKVSLGRFLASNWTAGLSGALIGISIFGIPIILRKEQEMSYVWLCLALLLIGILLAISSYRFALKSHSTIVLIERKEEISFWRRNKDQIVVAIIAAIIGSLITALVLWLSKLF